MALCGSAQGIMDGCNQHDNLSHQPKSISGLMFELLEEKWPGKKISLSHLKIFECMSYVHVDLDKRDKLDAKAKKMYFHCVWD